MAAGPHFESFAGIALLVLGLLVALARASQALLADGPEAADEPESTAGRRPATGAARIEREHGHDPWGDDSAEAEARRARSGAPDLSTGALLANVALSQGLFGAILIAAAWFAAIPPATLGVDAGDPWSVGVPALLAGIALGVVLYALNEFGATVADALGVDYSEGLREELAPDSAAGWLVLLGVVLPTIAGFEELLFRGVLVGAFAAGFGVSPWLLAAGSSAAFAVGHGAQGPGGVVVTGLLGFGLAAAFVLTGSLLVVIVAHYIVNALEFVVHERFGVERG